MLSLMGLRVLVGVLHDVCYACAVWGVAWGLCLLFTIDRKPPPGPPARLCQEHISKGRLTPGTPEPPDMSQCLRRSSPEARHGPGLQNLPEELVAKVKQHLSQLDWDCYRAACSLPLKRDLGRQECLNLGSGGVTRQERALLSDPLAQKLFVAFSVRRADGKFLQKLQLLSNLESLALYDCGLDAPIRCMFVSLTSLILWDCTLDASGCPAIRTLQFLSVYFSKVLLSGAGHPFPLVSRDAQSLYRLTLDQCEIVDVAGNGQLHIDAPQLTHVDLSNVRLKTRSTTCHFAGEQGVPPSLRHASVKDWKLSGPTRRMDPLLLDAFRAQILPQLTDLSLMYIPPGYLPPSAPALRSLAVYCPGKAGNAGPPCQARQYPREITTLVLGCYNGCSLHHAIQGAAKAGLQLRELTLTAGGDKKQTCTLNDGAFEGLEGTLEKLTIRTRKVDVGAVLRCLRECAQLTHLTLSRESLLSRQRSIDSPLPIPPEFLVVAMPTLQVLEIPLLAGYLDLQACPRLHSLHIRDAIDTQSQESPPLAGIIVGLRNVSKLFKMPDGGLWASPKGYSTHKDAHWHRQGTTDRCYACSSAQTVHLGTASV